MCLDLGVFAFAYDGVYMRTWARHAQSNVLSLAIFLAAWFSLRSFGNAGCGALLVHYAARGGLEALRYPALLRKSFRSLTLSCPGRGAAP